jgi:hypothetical protein
VNCLQIDVLLWWCVIFHLIKFLYDERLHCFSADLSNAVFEFNAVIISFSIVCMIKHTDNLILIQLDKVHACIFACLIEKVYRFLFSSSLCGLVKDNSEVLGLYLIKALCNHSHIRRVGGVRSTLILHH